MFSELVVAYLLFAGAGADLCLMLTVLFFVSSASCGIAVLLLVLSISSAGIQPALIAAGVM